MINCGELVAEFKAQAKEHGTPEQSPKNAFLKFVILGHLGDPVDDERLPPATSQQRPSLVSFVFSCPITSLAWVLNRNRLVRCFHRPPIMDLTACQGFGNESRRSNLKTIYSRVQDMVYLFDLVL